MTDTTTPTAPEAEAQRTVRRTLTDYAYNTDEGTERVFKCEDGAMRKATLLRRHMAETLAQGMPRVPAEGGAEYVSLWVILRRVTRTGFKGWMMEGVIHYVEHPHWGSAPTGEWAFMGAEVARPMPTLPPDPEQDGPPGWHDDATLWNGDAGI